MRLEPVIGEQAAQLVDLLGPRPSCRCIVVYRAPASRRALNMAVL